MAPADRLLCSSGVTPILFALTSSRCSSRSVEMRPGRSVLTRIQSAGCSRDGGRSPCQAVGVACRYGHPRAFGWQRARHCVTEALARAADHDDFILQSEIHLTSILLPHILTSSHPQILTSSDPQILR